MLPASAGSADAAIRVPRTLKEEHRFRLACGVDLVMAGGEALELLMVVLDFRRSAPTLPLDRAARAQHLRDARRSRLHNSPSAS